MLSFVKGIVKKELPLVGKKEVGQLRESFSQNLLFEKSCQKHMTPTPLEDFSRVAPSLRPHPTNNRWPK